MKQHKLQIIAAGLALCFCAGAALADTVVIRATGPGLKRGQIIPTGAVVALPRDSGALLLAPDGRTTQLKGPYSGSIAESEAAQRADANTATVLSRLLTASTRDTSALGGTRRVDLASPYAIALTGGNHCQIAAERPRFERDSPRPKTAVTITAASGASASLVWPEDASELGWPATVPFAAGSYSVSLDTMATPIGITVWMVPAAIKNPAALAQWMAEHNCTTQAMRLLTALR